MARLPQPGGDAGNWGTILNEFLGQTLNNDGTLKPNVVKASSIADDAISTSSIKDGIIAESKLDASLQAKVNGLGGGGTLTLSGDVSGPSNATVINNGKVSETKLDTALIAKINAKLDASQKGASGGIASLDNTGKVPSSQLPTIPAQLNPTAGSNVTITGTYPNLTFSATPGAGVTDLSTSRTASDVTVISSSGNDAVVPAASTTNAGVMSASDKSKLDGVAANATANATDAQLRDRSTHTGTQSISSISGLQSSLDSKVSQAVVTAKGDILAATSSATLARIGVGGQGQVLTVDNAQPAGLKWADAPSGGGSGGGAPTTYALGRVRYNSGWLSTRPSGYAYIDWIKSSPSDPDPDPSLMVVGDTISEWQ